MLCNDVLTMYGNLVCGRCVNSFFRDYQLSVQLRFPTCDLLVDFGRCRRAVATHRFDRVLHAQHFIDRLVEPGVGLLKIAKRKVG